MKNKRITPIVTLTLYIAIYVAVSSGCLTEFPLMHSDESWLAGLSRNMLAERNVGATETFFDAKVRYPHTFKTLFHLCQILFIRIFGYSLSSGFTCIPCL